ncbi:ATP-binding cassette domain-containing protein [Paraclostridium sp. AKS46]|nr:ATP-binding cassette domain-containing protein [Paraclostridium sp. AKS46]
MSDIISIEKLKKSIDNKDIINNLNLKINKGDVYGLLGMNGAGKTTLIKLIFDIYKPDEGVIKIMNYNSLKKNYEEFKKIGTMIEAPSFFENLSAVENLKIHCDYQNYSYENITDTIELVGLSEENDKAVKNYSLGMRQRLGIARAIVHKPELLILDEPINGLDPKGIVDVRNLLLKLNKELGITMLISSHIISELEKVSNRIGIMHDGEIYKEFELSENSDLDLESFVIALLQ